MERVSLELELVTPAFLAGADQAKAEWRVPSIRGQLRFWLRAVAGLETQDPAELRRIEEGVFGSTGRQSPVSFRIAGRPPLWRDEAVSFGHTWSAERPMAVAGEEGESLTFRALFRRQAHRLAGSLRTGEAYQPFELPA